MKTVSLTRWLNPPLRSWPLWGALIAGVWHAMGADPATPVSAPDLAAMSLEELATVQVASVYGASKHEQKVTEAPSTVSIVTADEIKKSGYRTLADILNGVRGFYTTSDRSYSYVGVRGFNRPGDYGGRILIAVDGHRMNDPLFDSAAIGTDFILDVDLIERVEVIRGPGSSLYGNNAFFGVINIITRRGREFEGAELSGSYSSYSTETGRISYGNRFTNGVELALSGTYFDSQGHSTVFYPEFIAVNQGKARDSDSIRFGSGFGSLSYKDFTLEGAYVNRFKQLPTAAYGAAFNDPRNNLLDERAFAELRYDHAFEDWQVLARGYYDHYRNEGQVPSPEFAYGDPLYPGQITLNQDRGDSESIGVEARVTRTFFDKHRLTAGTEYRHDLTLDLRNFDQAPAFTYLDVESSADTVGVYAQDEYAILSNLILNTGVRYDDFSSFGDTVNPRAALIYNPWTETTFKLLYGQAFRAPNAFERLYQAPVDLLEPLPPSARHCRQSDRPSSHLQIRQFGARSGRHFRGHLGRKDQLSKCPRPGLRDRYFRQYRRLRMRRF
jgi:outer membrane receptor for ferrienterochelin and colicins